MNALNIQNPHFICYKDDTLSIDILGGIDLSSMDRMLATLRICYQDYPPFRSTLDLYNDPQSDKLIRTLCDKWELKLIEVSQSIHQMILQLEQYRFEKIKTHKPQHQPTFQLSQQDKRQALKTLKSKQLIKHLQTLLSTIGIIGEDDNALILFLALASHKYSYPFSVLCLAKSGIGKSYILQKLSECLPLGSYSFHSSISPNALYYMDNQDVHNKALLIEDLEWTTEMLTPLATLQTQGKLVRTRTTKNKDGILHASTFEVKAKLCLIACAYEHRKLDALSLPFLCLHLNHSHSQDLDIMNYQQKLKAGLVSEDEVRATQHQLKCLIATLSNIKIINPYATLINLPKDIAHPRKSLLLLLDFIDTITYLFQHQRKQKTDKQTGEVFIQTDIQDIQLAFRLLKTSLFRQADELSTPIRLFYDWLTKHLTQSNTKATQFKAIDIRRVKSINPRTLNHYLHELKLFNYIQVVGGNKHRGGYLYKLTNLDKHTDNNTTIDNYIQDTLDRISKQVGKTPLANSKTKQS